MPKTIQDIILDEYISKELEISNPQTNTTNDGPLEYKIINKENYNKVRNNITQLQFPNLIKSHTDYIIAIGYLKNGADKLAIFPEEKKKFKLYAKAMKPLFWFHSPQDAYFANLYSIPINPESIKKINIAVMNLLRSTSMENYDIAKSLGKNMDLKNICNWLHKKHREMYLDLDKLLYPTPKAYEKEIILGMVHYCFYENRKTYKSKIEIAKKIYNFRVNSLKKITFPDKSQSKKLQVEIHYKIMEMITSYANENNIKIDIAVEILLKNGLHSINYGPGKVIISPPTTTYNY